jgi:FtsH-binding integral membrane protein
MKIAESTVYGLMAWGVGLWTVSMHFVIAFDYHMFFGTLVSPLLWIFFMFMMVKKRNINMVRLWWAWLSAPLALSYVIINYFLYQIIFNYKP